MGRPRGDVLSHGLDRVEVFTFGTRLTRITPDLHKRSVDEALARASLRVARAIFVSHEPRRPPALLSPA